MRVSAVRSEVVNGLNSKRLVVMMGIRASLQQ
jgi:hypothetical protein